jgi:uridylate kinase
MSETSEVKVISVGGSLIAPDDVDVDFLRGFYQTVVSYLSKDESRRIILVCGGGALARRYQEVYRQVAPQPEADCEDWIGVASTRLNAELLRQLFAEYCPLAVVTDPTDISVFPGRIMVASGWKPGFSTDYDAVLLAEKFSAEAVINLSNVVKVYTDDPKTNPDARPIDRISWKDFKEIVGDAWIPGKNAPFDPVAARRASEIGLRVIVASGRDTENLHEILEGNDFEGTVIGPE